MYHFGRRQETYALPEEGLTILTALVRSNITRLSKELAFKTTLSFGFFFRARFIAAFNRGSSVWRNKAFVQLGSVLILRARSAFFILIERRQLRTTRSKERQFKHRLASTTVWRLLLSERS